MYKPNQPAYVQKTHHKTQSGNALVYILIAIALIGVLTATIARQNEMTDNQDISDEQAELLALELIEYAAAAKGTIDQMIIMGADPDNIDFINPSSAAFDTAPHIDKLFHPSGGGLMHKELNEKAIHEPLPAQPAGIYVGMFNNVPWTPTTQQDVILTFFKIKQNVCEAINKKITGSTAIPNTFSQKEPQLIDDSITWVAALGANMDLSCPGCDGYAQICMSDEFAEYFSFYSILLAR